MPIIFCQSFIFCPQELIPELEKSLALPARERGLKLRMAHFLAQVG